ncbi:hypothetical protein DVS28_b0099 (plasmid) [Euzebya pacifica]|uniref:Uncharacterized protein n=1 Tax=Euzebya pacifica TaxID=1608957 RepID=A0A346Y5X2_9ACTN|nr:hypothetical protein [Euzebya pacifica]AXV09869.1 hypothetical protein DVS28_b0099 [Euzebya pacifica]
MTVMFHLTPAVNVPSVLTEGLRAAAGPRTGRIADTAGVYLFTDTDAVDTALAGWFGDEFGDDVELAAFAVDTTGLDLDADAPFERRSCLPIGPERLTLLHRPDWT